jgi:hypothetical protein
MGSRRWCTKSVYVSPAVRTLGMRTIVLEVGAEALGFKGNPERILMHGVGVLGPVAEVVCVYGKGLAEIFDGVRVFVAENLRVWVSLCLSLVYQIVEREAGG